MLFLAPPFTPSHPVFIHLSSVAAAQSEKARDAAEEYLSKIAEEKAAEIKVVEAGLKREVELLWSKFKENLEAAHQDGSTTSQPSSSLSGRRLSHTIWSGLTSPGADGASGHPSSVRISEFVPVQNIPRRTSSVVSPRQVTSTLSASLASTSFHYPRAQGPERAVASARDGSTRSSSPSSQSVTPPSLSRSSTTRVVSPSTASSRTVAAMAINGNESISIREAYRRNMDQSKDIATSFRYVVDMEQQAMAHLTHREPSPPVDASTSVNGAENSSVVSAPRGRSPRAGKSSFKKGKAEAIASQPEENRPTTPTQTSHDGEDTSPRGKRKVTFDVKPAVAIIDEETFEAENNDTVVDQDIIFDMEAEEPTDGREPLQEPPALVNGNTSSVPSSEADTPNPGLRRARSRLQNDYGLPASLSSLRPASLPNISAMRRPVPRDEPTDRPRSQVVRESVVTTADSNRSPVNGRFEQLDIEEEVTDPREAEILRLVAASTPSHRSAWKRNSRAWQLFVNRQSRKSKDPGPVAIEEEDESDTSPEYDGPRLGRQDGDEVDDLSDDWTDDRLGRHEGGIASSLPIPIMPMASHFGAASYQQKTSLSDRPGILVPALRPSSSVAARKAVYAERDRLRDIDPGALEFIDDLDDDDEDDVEADTEVGSVGRRRALKILKARDELPEAGMWRSLA